VYLFAAFVKAPVSHFRKSVSLFLTFVKVEFHFSLAIETDFRKMTRTTETTTSENNQIDVALLNNMNLPVHTIPGTVYCTTSPHPTIQRRSALSPEVIRPKLLLEFNQHLFQTNVCDTPDEGTEFTWDRPGKHRVMEVLCANKQGFHYEYDEEDEDLLEAHDKLDQAWYDDVTPVGIMVYDGCELTSKQTGKLLDIMPYVLRYDTACFIPYDIMFKGGHLRFLSELCEKEECYIAWRDVVILRDWIGVFIPNLRLCERIQWNPTVEFCVPRPPDTIQIYYLWNGYIKHLQRLRMYYWDRDGSLIERRTDDESWTSALEGMAPEVRELYKRFDIRQRKDFGTPDERVVVKGKGDATFSAKVLFGDDRAKIVNDMIDRADRVTMRVDDATVHLPETMANVTAASSAIASAAGSCTSILEKIKDMLPDKTAASTLKTVVSAITQLQIPNIATYVTRLLHLLYDVLNGAFRGSIVGSLIRFTARVLAALDLDHWASDRIWHLLGMTEKEDMPIVEGGADGGPLSPLKYIVTLVVSGLFAKEANPSTIKRVIDSLTLTEKVTKSVDTFEGFILSALKYLPDVLQKAIHKLIPDGFWAEHIKNGEYAAWAQATMVFLQETTPQDYMYNLQVREKLYALEKKAYQLFTEGAVHLESAKGSKWYQHVNQLSSKLAKTARDVRAAVANQIEREEPFCVYLTGPPGVGKSRLIDTLTTLTAPEGISDPSAVKYARTHTKFWDGYTGQPVVFLDDFFQTRDPDEALELISMISPTKYPLDMASLDNTAIGVKGTLFNSKVVLVTSNAAYPELNEMISYHALWRRRHVLIAVKAPIVDGVGDPAAFKNDCSHLRFDILHPTMPNVVLMAGLTLKEMLLHVKGQQKLHERRQRERMETDAVTREMAKEAKDLYDRPPEVILPIPDDAPLPDVPIVQGGAQSRIKREFNTAYMNEFFQPAHPERFESLQNVPIEINQRMKRIRGTPHWKMCCMAYGNPTAADIDCAGMTDDEIKRGYPDAAIDQTDAYRRDRQQTMYSKKEATDDIFASWAKGWLAEDLPADPAASLSFQRRQLVAKQYDGFMDEMSDNITTAANNFKTRHPIIYSLTAMTAWIALITGITVAVVKMLNHFLKGYRIHERTQAMSDQWIEHVREMMDVNETAPEARNNLESLLSMQQKLMRDTINVLEDADEERVRDYVEKFREHYDTIRGLRPVIEGPSPTVRKYDMEKDRARYQQRQLRKANRPTVKGSIDNAAMDLIDASLPSNLVMLEVYTPDQQIEMNTQGLMIGGTVVLAPRHLFMKKKDGSLIDENYTVFIVTDKGAGFEVRFDREALFELKDSHGVKDAVLYDLGPRVPPFKRRIDNFISENDLDKLKSFQGMLVKLKLPPKGERLPVVHTTHCPLVEPIEEDVEYFSKEDEDAGYSLTLVKGWQHGSPTQKGDCGSPLVALNSRITGKLCGIHVAGSDHINYSELITKEMLAPALVSMIRQNPNMVQVKGLPKTAVIGEGLKDFSQAKVIPNGNYSGVGEADPRSLPRLPRETQLQPSPIHGIYPVLKEPAALSPNDERIDPDLRAAGHSMIKMGVEKYTRPNAPMRLKSRKRAIKAINEEFMRMARTFPKPELRTIHEALNGVPGREYFSGMNFDSSPGYPYVMWRPTGQTGKHFLMEGEPGERKIKDNRLVSEIETREKLAKQGERYESLWLSTLKDELLPTEKIAVGKTRMFTIGNVAFTILVRKYMLDFCAFFYECRLKCGSAVGINPEGMEWEQLYNRLTGCSDTGFAGDFSRYDGTLQSEAIWGLVELINMFYDDGHENALVRQVLVNEMIHTEMTCLNTIIIKHQGNPSGCPLTVIINTYVNMVYMLYAWLENAPMEMDSPAFFYENVRLAIYGDDNIVAVKRPCQHFYNMKTVSSALAACGLEYTAPDKSSRNVDIKPIKEWTFLKRGFHVEGNRVLALMEERTITEMLNWIRKCDDPWEACMENAATALSFAFAYGPAYFNAMRDNILRAVAKNSKRPTHIPTLPDYDYYNRFYGATRDMPVIRMWNGKLTTDFRDCDYFRTDNIAKDENQQPTLEGGLICPSAWKRIFGRKRPIVKGDNEDGVALKEVVTAIDNTVGEPEETTVAENIAGYTTTQQTGTISTERPESSTTERKANMFVPDIDWALTTMVEKPTLVDTIDWTVSQASRTVLTQLYGPQEFWANNFNHAPFELFQYWRGTMIVTFQINGTPFHQGRLIAFWCPLLNKERVNTWHRIHAPASTTVPHVQLDPAISNTVELRIPFVNPNHYLDLGRILDDSANSIKLLNYMGTLTLLVQNPLKAATGATQTLKITMHVRFTDNNWAVPKPESLCTTNLRKVRQRLSDSKVVVKGLGDGLAGTFGNIKRAILNTIGPTQIMDAIAGVTVMDKPTVATEPELYTPNKCGFYSNSTNVTQMERFSLLPKDYEMSTHETFGTKMDEMDIAYMCKIWNLDYTMTWNTSAPTGTIVNAGYICPCPNALWKQTSTGGAPWWLPETKVAPTMMDYVSAKFTFWEGSIKFKFQIIASKYHSGRLAFTIHDGTFNQAEIPTGLSARMSQFTTLLDLGANNNEFEIVIPYYAIRKLRVPNGQNIPHSFGDLNDLEDYACGMWVLSVVNPLVAPSGVATSVDINHWRAAGDDFHLENIANTNVALIPVNGDEGNRYNAEHDVHKQNNIAFRPGTDACAPPVSRVTVKGDAEGVGLRGTPRATKIEVDNNKEMIHMGKQHALVAAPRSGRMIPSKSAVKSLGDIIKRYHRQSVYVWEVPDAQVKYRYPFFKWDIGYALFGNFPAPTPDPTAVQSWGRSGLFTWFSKLYCGYHGSVRYKLDFITDGAKIRSFCFFEPTPSVGSAVKTMALTPDQVNLSAAVVNWNFDGASSANDMLVSPAHSVNIGATGMQPIEVPFVSAYKFLIIPDDSIEDDSIIGHPLTTVGTMFSGLSAVQSGYETIDKVVVEVNIEVAAGDEFRFGLLLGPPFVYVSPVKVFPDNYVARP
jgi:hypothetical protein